MRALQVLAWMSKRADLQNSVDSGSRSGLKFGPTPISQQTVPTPTVEKPNYNPTGNKIQEPTPASAAKTPYMDWLAHKGKKPLTDNMHGPKFKRLQGQLSPTDQMRENFISNLPYDPKNQTMTYALNQVLPVANPRASKGVWHLAYNFKDQAGREYTNNMFRHARPPRAFNADDPDTAYYSPLTKSIALGRDSDDIDSYMHELTHSMGADAKDDRWEVPYADSKFRAGEKYDPEAEYAATTAGHLARLKTNQRAHEMAHSVQLPAQLAAVLNSPNPFASTAGALAGHRGAATLTMPGGNIIHPETSDRPIDPYNRSLRSAWRAAHDSNYFTPQSYEDTANIYPVFRKDEALWHMQRPKPGTTNFSAR